MAMAKQTPLDHNEFVDHVEAATRQAGFVIQNRDGMMLTLEMQGQPMRCDLKRLYGVYQLQPDRLDDIVAAHLAALGEADKPRPPLSEKQALESFLPLLNPAAWLDVVRKQGAEPPVHRPFAAGLVINYVFDLPDARAYIHQATYDEILTAPDATPDSVHEMALANLRKRTSRRNTKAYGMGDGTIIVCDTRDGFAATRVLLPELMATWAERIPGRMLLGVPNRDFLIAFSDRDPGQVAVMTQQIRRDAAQREGGLTAELLMWRNGRVAPHRTVH
jgi:uncharacterized protein YtpQ (UPF0354 family)